MMKLPQMIGLSTFCVLAMCSTVGSDEASDMELRATITALSERLAQLEKSAGQAAQPSRTLQGNADALADLYVAMDHMWLIICGALVMFMQAGFAMLCAGCCRAKNVQNILLKNVTDVCMGTVCWFAIGWGLAYGPGIPDGDDGSTGNKFAGTGEFFGIGFNTDNSDGSITPGSKPLNWYFQWAFCSAAATIVSGAVAERVNFYGYVIYSIAMTAVIYPVVVAWTWGYGWLSSEVNDVNYMDFAGSGIVHMTGGVASLVGSIVAGPRKDRWTKPEEFDPHNLPLVVLGTFLLWFGWYGFNCGSTLGLHTAAQGMMAAQVAMNTTISAAVGGITVFLLRYALIKRYDLGALCNGILAGLVSVTAGCGNVEPGSAFGIGMVGGCLYLAASTGLKKLKIDDPLDAFPVHGVCGAWGVLAAALFDWGKAFDHVHAWSGFDCMRDDNGDCLKGVGGQLLAANVVEILAITAWVVTCSTILFVSLRLVGFLRASDEAQDAGMDSAKHSPDQAYVMDMSPPTKTMSDKCDQGVIMPQSI
jgi:Amt family ammonium transporter